MSLISNGVKHCYQRVDNVEVGTTLLKWLDPSTCSFEETNFKHEFCSLVALSEGNHKIFIVDPKDPKNILGQLFWYKGVIKPKWISAEAKKLFDAAETAIRKKLNEDGSLFSDVEFDYKNLQISLSEGVCAIHGAFNAVGFDEAFASFSYREDGHLGLVVTDNNPAPSLVPYSHESVKMKSKIAGDADAEVHYSIFRPESAGAVAEGVSSKKTFVYIPGGPWSAFNTHNFLSQYKPFIEDGYTIVVPHEPTRGGFGYNYFFGEKQLGRRNLHHIMNILDDACAKGVNPEMVLMGESYGGWVASALAAKWRDLGPAGSTVELHACIAQADDLDWIEWKKNIDKSGHRQYLKTFGDDVIDVASITALQAPLLICHGLGDVRCPIESIQGWAKALRTAGQPVAFIATPEGHTGLLASSFMCGAEECEIRLNIVRRFFEGCSIPAASTKKLGEYGIEVFHDNLDLFEMSVAVAAAWATTAATHA